MDNTEIISSLQAIYQQAKSVDFDKNEISQMVSALALNMAKDVHDDQRMTYTSVLDLLNYTDEPNRFCYQCELVVLSIKGVDID